MNPIGQTTAAELSAKTGLKESYCEAFRAAMMRLVPQTNCRYIGSSSHVGLYDAYMLVNVSGGKVGVTLRKNSFGDAVVDVGLRHSFIIRESVSGPRPTRPGQNPILVPMSKLADRIREVLRSAGL